MQVMSSSSVTLSSGFHGGNHVSGEIKHDFGSKMDGKFKDPEERRRDQEILSNEIRKEHFEDGETCSTPRFGRSNENEGIDGELVHDFGAKMNLKVRDPEEGRRDEERLNKAVQEEDLDAVKAGKEEENEEDDEEFSFSCGNPTNAAITADVAFQDGQIRPVFPLFDRSLLFDGEDELPGTRVRKLYMEETRGGSLETSDSSSESESESTTSNPQGPYCDWTSRTVEEALPSGCKKSNSTGFSKLRRFRELVTRSKSDGKDAFVFLNKSNSANSNNTCSIRRNADSMPSAPVTVKVVDQNVAGNNNSDGKGQKEATTAATAKLKVKKGKSASAHEKHYVMSRKNREDDKRKSYLPYRQVGFFTNVNGLSKNVHPF